MNKATKNNLCPNLKIKKFMFIIQYRISQRINQIFEILGMYCFAFTALTIDKIFKQHNFLPCNIEIMYFPINIYEQIRPKIRENLRTANFNPKFTGH